MQEEQMYIYTREKERDFLMKIPKTLLSKYFGIIELTQLSFANEDSLRGI